MYTVISIEIVNGLVTNTSLIDNYSKNYVLGMGVELPTSKHNPTTMNFEYPTHTVQIIVILQ